MRKKIPALVIAGTGVLAICACATHVSYDLMTPRSAGEPFGYEEQRLSDTRYEITYSGPEVATTNTTDDLVYAAKERARTAAQDLAMWRAADLALAKGYPAFAVISTAADVKQIIVGHDYHQNGNPVYDNVTGEAYGYQTATYFRPEAKIRIELRRDRAQGTFDAGEVSQNMKRAYSNVVAEAIGPNTYFYFGTSPFLHDRPAARRDDDRGGPHLEHAPYAGETY